MKNLLSVIVFIACSCVAQGYAQKTVKAPACTPKPEIERQHAYHQTLTMKLFLAETGAEKGEGAQLKRRDKGECKVSLNFEQALEVIRKIDHLTLGIPKIIYLVGWQYDGHDSKYPAWDEVNHRLKRPQDRTALESMKWLMEEAFRYNTTVSVHINMFDAYEDSPLWDTYVENGIIARNADGSLRKGEWGWPISYTQEWKTGFAQQRIDRICAMLPLKKAGTVHIDAFHTWVPLEPEGPVSPYLGYTVEEETETQRKIYKYWRSKGVDVTSEGMRFLRISAFEGLQPAAWWFSPSVDEYMKWPASYYCGGTTNEPAGLLFGKSMHGEDLVRKDPEGLAGFLRQFCTQTLPWYYLNRLDRQTYSEKKNGREVAFSEGVVTHLDDREYFIRQNGRLLLRNGDVFMPALWMDHPAIIAYSTDGYRQPQHWEFPADWKEVTAVDLFRLTPDGPEPKQEKVAVRNGKLSLALDRDEAVLIAPSGEMTGTLRQDTLSIASLGLKPDTRENAVRYVQEALEACKGLSRPVLVFPKGRYDFWPQYAVEREYFESNTTDINPKRLAILIEGMEGLTVDGSGSEFIFHDRIQPFTVDNSRRITVKNVSIDWDIPLSAQALVGEVTGTYVDLHINALESPHIIENGKLVFTGEGWKSEWGGTIEFEKDGWRVAPQSADNVFGEGWRDYRAEDMDGEGRTVRLHHTFKRTPQTGNRLVLRHSARDHAGIFITGSDRVRLERINIYHTAGLGVLAQYASNLSYERVNCVPNEAKGRILAGHDDGFHYSNCRGQIRISRCRFHALMDDPVNVHGTGVKIIEKLSDTGVRCRFMHHQSQGLQWGRAGETVGFINHLNMHTVASGTIKSFRPIDVETMEIEFEQPLPAAIKAGDGLENLTWTPDVDIRNSFFGSCRARGILISTPGRVVIEQNIFESSGSPVLIAGDANYWYETGAVKEVLIRRNTFRAPCLTSMYQFCEAVISICPEIPEVNPSLPYHRNITVTDNEFHLFDYPLLYALSVENISFTNNRLIRDHSYTPWHPRKDGLTFEACRKITVRNNILEGDIPGTRIALPKTPAHELTLDKHSGFKR
ncbi:MAG: endo-alpha-N-acetylgalactosaminidase family protein [Tannerella sp.]|jgi:hypothetical protein|nr:endo-alpha-N-acetylgalactosaminidase family protein [Tannerella sp.]